MSALPVRVKRVLLLVAVVSITLAAWHSAQLRPIIAAQWVNEAVHDMTAGSLVPTQGSNDKFEIRYDPDAHRLPSAIDFRGHFEAVMNLPLKPLDELRAPCTWPPEEAEKINWQFPVDDLDWYQLPWNHSRTAEWRSKLQQFVRHGFSSVDPARFHGRGVVITGGNGNSKTRIETLLRQLVRLAGSDMIPVEIHFWGKEIDAEHQEALRHWYPSVLFNDLSTDNNIIPTTYIPNWPNYNLKIAAVLNSRFEEMLVMDSDIIPLVHPYELFETQKYKDYGTVFWPDVVRTRRENPAWGIANSPCRPDEYEMESGQILIDKRKFWYHLQLALWLVRMETEESGTRHSFFLGDKDAFRFAWKALHTQYGEPSSWLSVVGYMPKPFEFCGIAFGQYHPEKIALAFFHANSLKYHNAEALDWVSQHILGGVFGLIQQHPQSTNFSYNFPWGMARDDESYLPHSNLESSNGFMGICSRIPDLEAKPLEELLPGGFWHDWEAIKPENPPSAVLNGPI